MDGSDGKGVDDAPRIPVGTHGLDPILAGGLPPGRLSLLAGMPGSGKTTLALRFLLEASEVRERRPYVTVSETKDALRDGARSHGRDLDSPHPIELAAADGFGTDRERSLLQPGEVEPGETLCSAVARVEADTPRRVVLEGEVRTSIAVIETRASDHKLTIRKVRIDAGGIRMGEPITAFPGILSDRLHGAAGAGARIGSCGAGDR